MVIVDVQLSLQRPSCHQVLITHAALSARSALSHKMDSFLMIGCSEPETLSVLPWKGMQGLCILPLWPIPWGDIELNWFLQSKARSGQLFSKSIRNLQRRLQLSLEGLLLNVPCTKAEKILD